MTPEQHEIVHDATERMLATTTTVLRFGASHRVRVDVAQEAIAAQVASFPFSASEKIDYLTGLLAEAAVRIAEATQDGYSNA